MWNLHCPMKPVSLPCLPKLITALLLQQPPPIPLLHTLKDLLICSHDCRTAFVFKAMFLLVQLRAAVAGWGLSAQTAQPAGRHSQEPHTGHWQERPGENKAQGSLLVQMEQILIVVGILGGWIGV